MPQTLATSWGIGRLELFNQSAPVSRTQILVREASSSTPKPQHQLAASKRPVIFCRSPPSSVHGLCADSRIDISCIEDVQYTVLLAGEQRKATIRSTANIPSQHRLSLQVQPCHWWDTGNIFTSPAIDAINAKWHQGNAQVSFHGFGQDNSSSGHIVACRSDEQAIQSRTARENSLVLISAIERLAMSQPKIHFVCPVPLPMHPQTWLPLPHRLGSWTFSRNNTVCGTRALRPVAC